MRIPLLVLAALAACNRPAPPAEAATARAGIEAVNARWSADIAAGRADSIAMLYAPDARMMGPGAPTAMGRDAIRQAFTQMLQLGKWNIQLHTDSVWANGPLVLEVGTWTSSFKPGPNAPPIDTAETGKYMVRWTQENGAWLLADDIYNSNKMPAPPPATAPPKRRH